MKNKLTAFVLIGGGTAEVSFYSNFKMLTYNFFFHPGREERHVNQKEDFRKNARLSSSEDNAEQQKDL